MSTSTPINEDSPVQEFLDQQKKDITTSQTKQPEQLQQQPPVQPKEVPIDVILNQMQQTLNDQKLITLSNTLTSLDNLDKIIASLNNMQGFVMNIKEDVKKQQLTIFQPDTANNKKDESQQNLV